MPVCETGTVRWVVAPARWVAATLTGPSLGLGTQIEANGFTERLPAMIPSSAVVGQGPRRWGRCCGAVPRSERLGPSLTGEREVV